MQTVVKETDAETKLRWRLPTDGPIDFDNDRYNETWWDELEKAVLKHSVSYYEDIIEPTADNVAGWIRDVIGASEDTTVYLVSEENRSLKN